MEEYKLSYTFLIIFQITIIGLVEGELQGKSGSSGNTISEDLHELAQNSWPFRASLALHPFHF